MLKTRCFSACWTLCLALLIAAGACAQEDSPQRLRILIETDTGGDPDDEQSLVRFLLYTNEWDVEGILCNRKQARLGENLNPERTGVGIVHRAIRAYGECYTKLVQHDPNYPHPNQLLARTIAGHDDTDASVLRIIELVDSNDPRPLWYCDWGTDQGAGTVNMKRALDRIYRQRTPEAYARFKNKLRIVGYDQFPQHTQRIDPHFTFWINTFQPPRDGKRWYHRFGPLTATAGGFDIQRDLLTGHGPLGAIYPTNVTIPQKEGDTMTFLYLVPTGMNDPERPTWGSWAGRYGVQEDFPDKPYYWANQEDTWNGSTHRDHTLARWASHFQNDFRARLDWCVRDKSGANHPPNPKLVGDTRRTVHSGEQIILDATPSSDPDGHQRLRYEWFHYPEPGSYLGPVLEIKNVNSNRASLVAPSGEAGQTIHVILMVTDDGDPPLTRYQRIILTLDPS